MEMVGAIVHQLTRNLSDRQIQDSSFAPYFVDHTVGVFPAAAAGYPWTAASMQVKGDPMTDLTEDLAAEQKARTTYDNILRLSDDPDVNAECMRLEAEWRKTRSVHQVLAGAGDCSFSAVWRSLSAAA